MTAGRGRFITFEGGEGGGKSTQLRLLVESLRAAGRDVMATREPGGAPGAEAIRRLLVEGDVGRWDAVTEALLHTAARRDHLRATVWPALDAGKWVVCDRFADSTIAYQGVGHGLGTDLVRKLQAIATGGFGPDLTIILDIDAETGLARAGRRGGGEDRYERMGLDFHQRLRQAFLDIAAAEPQRCAVIDSAGPLETVHEAVLAVVRARLPEALS